MIFEEAVKLGSYYNVLVKVLWHETSADLSKDVMLTDIFKALNHSSFIGGVPFVSSLTLGKWKRNKF